MLYWALAWSIPELTQLKHVFKWQSFICREDLSLPATEIPLVMWGSVGYMVWVTSYQPTLDMCQTQSWLSKQTMNKLQKQIKCTDIALILSKTSLKNLACDFQSNLLWKGCCGGSVIKALSYRAEGHVFKSQHPQTTVILSLSKSLELNCVMH